MKAAQFEITSPRHFTVGAILVASVYGLVLVVPVLAAVLAMSVQRFSLFSLALVFVAVGITSFFLPFGFGNAYVTRLVGSLGSGEVKPEGFIVQLTFSPRIRSGFRATLEDADDVGYLEVTNTELIFHGDSIQLSLPCDQLRDVRRRNIGLRGLYVYGQRIVIAVSGLPGVDSLEFAERSSLLLPASRRITRRLHERIAACTAGGQKAKAGS